MRTKLKNTIYICRIINSKLYPYEKSNLFNSVFTFSIFKL